MLLCSPMFACSILALMMASLPLFIHAGQMSPTRYGGSPRSHHLPCSPQQQHSPVEHSFTTPEVATFMRYHIFSSPPRYPTITIPNTHLFSPPVHVSFKIASSNNNKHACTSTPFAGEKKLDVMCMRGSDIHRYL